MQVRSGFDNLGRKDEFGRKFVDFAGKYPCVVIKKKIESGKYAILMTRETYQFKLQFCLSNKIENGSW
jgi:hypothetical protein